MSNATGSMLRRVARRQRIASAARTWSGGCMAMAGAYAAVLVASRLLGVIPDFFRPEQLLLVPAAALVPALIFHHRPNSRETARLVDLRQDTDTLFLTAVSIDRAAGGYGQLVLHRADRAAQAVDPRHVLPFRSYRPARNAALALVLVGLAVLLLPQFDPLGSRRQRRQRDRQREELSAMRERTRERLAELKAQKPDAELSEAVARALDDLKNEFRKLSPADPPGNQKRLATVRKELGQMWKKAAGERLRNLYHADFGSPQLGGSEKMQQWRKELEQGRLDSVRKELSELKEMAQRLAQERDPQRRDALRREMQRSLEQLGDFAAQSFQSQAPNAAVQQALQQLAMSQDADLSVEALAGLQESLDLTSAQLAELAQSLRDRQALEQALRSLQMAQEAVQNGQFDPEALQEAEALADYAELFEQMGAGKCPRCGGRVGADGQCASCGDTPGGSGAGRGISGPGEGGDAMAGERETDVKPTIAKDRTALRAGKMLMTLKTRGVTESGETRRGYADYVRQVKQGTSEAIVHEQIPPAYHAAIQKYFDNLDVESGRGDED